MRPRWIVGITPDTKLSDLTEEPQPLLMRSLAQSAAGRSIILVRTAGDPGAVTGAVSRTLAGLDPTIAVIGPRSLRDATRAALAAGQSGARASGIFGALALLLSVAGLYGVVYYGVTRKRREIGIRMALGAGTGRVASSVVRSGLTLLATGFALGALLSLAMSGVMRGMVYGVSPTDPLTLLLVGVVILAVGALASWIPARRASRVDPIQVLRATEGARDRGGCIGRRSPGRTDGTMSRRRATWPVSDGMTSRRRATWPVATRQRAEGCEGGRRAGRRSRTASARTGGGRAARR